MNELVEKLFELANRHYDGEGGGKKNHFEALRYYKAVLTHQPDHKGACRRLAEASYYGLGVERSFVMVHAYLQQAGVAREEMEFLGSHKLGDLARGDAAYWEEQGNEFYNKRRLALAAECYLLSLTESREQKKAPRNNSVRRLAEIAKTKKDYLSAARWISMLELSEEDKQTYIESTSHWRGIADAYYDKKEYTEAIAAYESALEAATEEDQVQKREIAEFLFSIYHSGQYPGVPYDMQKALRLYFLRAEGSEQDEFEALKEKQSEQSYKDGNKASAIGQKLEAIRLWEWAALVNHHVEAMLALGRAYKNGDGVKRSALIAAQWLRQAVERDCDNAQLELGDSVYWNGQFENYFEGLNGSKQDHTEALYCAEWRLLHVDSKEERYGIFMQIGKIYEQARAGIKKDPKKALRHYMAAEAQSSSIGELHVARQNIRRIQAYEPTIAKVARYALPLGLASYHAYKGNWGKASFTMGASAASIASEQFFGRNSWTNLLLQWAPYSASLGFKPHTILIHSLVSAGAVWGTDKALGASSPYIDPWITALGDSTGICDEEFKAAIRIAAHFSTQLLATKVADRVNKSVESRAKKAAETVHKRISEAKRYINEVRKVKEPDLSDKKTSVKKNPIEEMPAEDTPVEEMSAEDTPAEKNPVTEMPAEDTPAEENPVTEMSAEDTPAEENPVTEMPAEDTPAEENPGMGASTEEISVEEMPIPEESVKETPAEEIQMSSPEINRRKGPRIEVLHEAAMPGHRHDYHERKRSTHSYLHRDFREGDLGACYDKLKKGEDVSLVAWHSRGKFSTRTKKKCTIDIYTQTEDHSKQLQKLSGNDHWRVDGIGKHKVDGGHIRSIGKYTRHLEAGNPVTMRHNNGKKIVVLYPVHQEPVLPVVPVETPVVPVETPVVPVETPVVETINPEPKKLESLFSPSQPELSFFEGAKEGEVMHFVDVGAERRWEAIAQDEIADIFRAENGKIHFSCQKSSPSGSREYTDVNFFTVGPDGNLLINGVTRGISKFQAWVDYCFDPKYEQADSYEIDGVRYSIHGLTSESLYQNILEAMGNNKAVTVMSSDRHRYVFYPSRSLVNGYEEFYHLLEDATQNVSAIKESTAQYIEEVADVQARAGEAVGITMPDATGSIDEANTRVAAIEVPDVSESSTLVNFEDFHGGNPLVLTPDLKTDVDFIHAKVSSAKASVVRSLEPLTGKSKWETLGTGYLELCDKSNSFLQPPRLLSTLLAGQWAARYQEPTPEKATLGEKSSSSKKPSWIAARPQGPMS